jgi:hypothetical protein
MATAKIWSNVQVAMQSVLAAADTVTGITQANPGVVSSTAHGIANGAYVLANIEGMKEINGRVFRVANTAANAFDLEGENTTTYDAFSSGNVQEITFGTSFGTVRGLTTNGGDFPFIDTTTIHDKVATQIPGIASAISYSFEHIWDVANAALIAMKLASDQKAQRAFRFTFANGAIMVFNGYCGATLIPAGNAQDLVTTQTTITMFGSPTYYAS